MGKIYNRKFLFVIATVITCIVIAVIIRLCFVQRIVRMSISPTELYVGEKIYYSDSTRNADTWLWEFETEIRLLKEQATIPLRMPVNIWCVLQ